jgi:hypothetical protein
MDIFSGTLGGLALLFGLGIVYLSRFLLRKHAKRTGSELESIDSELEGIHRTYRVLNTATLLAAGFFLFLIYQRNRAFWEERIIVLFIPVFAVFALFDGLFALRTKVFPTTTKYNLNSYVYDRDDELRWIAFWQIGLSVLLLVLDGVILSFTL